MVGFVLAALVVGALPVRGFAGPSAFIGGRPIKLEGYMHPSDGAPDVLLEATVSARGHDRLRFGITRLQAYKPEEEGVQVLRHSTLQPVTLLLRGPAPLVQRFLGARPDEKVVAYGIYLGGPGNFTLGTVDLLPREPPPAR